MSLVLTLTIHNKQFRQIMTADDSEPALPAPPRQARKKIFDQLDWTEVVTLFLQSVSSDEIKLVNIRIPTDNFKFIPSEFYSLLSEIEPLQKRFEAINTLQHPLNVLNTSLIDLSDFEEGADQFHLLLNEERNNFRFILVEYSNGLAQYSDSLNIHLFKKLTH